MRKIVALAALSVGLLANYGCIKYDADHAHIMNEQRVIYTYDLKEHSGGFATRNPSPSCPLRVYHQRPHEPF